MSRVVALILGACVCMHCDAAEANARTFEQDNTGLIQSAIMTKAAEEKALAESSKKDAATDAKLRQHPHCQENCDANGDDPSTCLFNANAEGELVEADPLVSFAQEKPEVQQPAPSAKDTSTGEEAALPALVLRRSLTALICLLILDGMRRWLLTLDDSPKEKRSVATAASETLEEKFMVAALRGDATAGEALLAQGLAVDQADVWGSTLLHAAAKGGSKNLVSLLLQRGAKVDALDAWDETPLHLAAQSGWNEVCDLLLAFGSGIDARNLQGLTPLVVAAEQGKDDTFKLLLSRAASIPEGEDFDRLPPLLQTLLSEQRIYSNEEHTEANLRYGLDGEESDFNFDGFEE